MFWGVEKSSNITTTQSTASNHNSSAEKNRLVTCFYTGFSIVPPLSVHHFCSFCAPFLSVFVRFVPLPQDEFERDRVLWGGGLI